MKIEITAKHLIGMAMIAILFLIGLMFTAIRLTQWASNKSPDAPVSSPTASAPSASAPVTALPPPIPGGDSSVLSLIKANDFAQLKANCDSARVRGDYRYLRRVYLLACEHGSSGTFQAIGQVAMNPTNEEVEEILGAASKLCDRSDIDAVRAGLQQLSRHGVSREREAGWLVEQFNRDPWNEERFKRIAAGFRRMDTALAELIKSSLQGSDVRFAYIQNILKNEQNSAYQQPLDTLLQDDKLYNDKNIDRLLEIMTYSRVSPEQALSKCAPYLQPKHFELVRKVMKNRSLTPPLLNYVLKQDPAVISSWAAENESLRFRMVSLVEESLREGSSQTAPDPEVFISLVKMRKQQEPEWNPYPTLIATASDRVQLLWENGIRPPAKDVRSQVYLAVRYQDRVLLEQVLQTKSPDLDSVLNFGVQSRGMTQQSHETKFFVPILEAIRNWDLPAVKLLADSGIHNWAKWQNDSPLFLAISLKKKDVYNCLVEAGARWDDKGRAGLTTLTDVDPDVIDDAVPADSKEAFQLHINLMAQAVTSNDLKKLDDALRRFHSARKAKNGNSYQQRLAERQNYAMSLGSQPEARRVVELAIANPACFERLQFEGFPIDVPIVQKILTDEKRETLDFALRNLNLRRDCMAQSLGILAAVRDKPAMLEYYAQQGMFDNAPENLKDEIRKQYTAITGKRLK